MISIIPSICHQPWPLATITRYPRAKKLTSRSLHGVLRIMHPHELVPCTIQPPVSVIILDPPVHALVRFD